MLASNSNLGNVPEPEDPTSCEPDRFWRRIVQPIESSLIQVAHELNQQVEAFEPEISAYARYALASQGKQLRPALLILSGSRNHGIHRIHGSLTARLQCILCIPWF